MTPRQTRGPMHWHLLALLGLLVIGPAMGVSSRAADLDSLDNSLKWIPADAAYYSTMLRNREQVDAVTKSRAWARLTNLPIVQMGWQQAMAQWNNPEGDLAEFKRLVELPENQELIQLLIDMGSTEVFFYGGASWVDFTDLAMQLNSSMRFGPLMARATGKAPMDLNDNDMAGWAMLQVLSQNVDLIKIPDTVIGFKISDTKRAEAQILRLQLLLEEMLKQEAPELVGRLKREKVGDTEFLTLNLDGSLLPWEEFDFKKYETRPGEYDALIAKLKSQKLTIALGIKDNYVLLSISGAGNAVTQLGQGEKLTSRKELQPLASHATRKLTSINYLSQDVTGRLVTNRKDIDDWVDQLDQLVQKSAEIPDELRGRLRKDIVALARDLKGMLPEPGALLSFTFMNDRGYESFTYNWGQFTGTDGSKPLTILQHVGGSPLVAVGGRAKYQPQNYETAVKWAKVAYDYFKDVGVPALDDTQREQFEKWSKVALPILAQMDEVNRNLLLPALADGQSAFVFDGKTTSQAPVLIMPPGEKPLPLPEIALVFGVSDAKKLEEACSRYRTLLNALLGSARDENPMQVPEVQIPPATSQQIKGGTMYFYPLPPLPIDQKILPNAGLSEKIAVLSLTQSQTQRILTATPLKVDGGPLADLGRPRAGAAYVDIAGLVDFITPWVEYGMQTAATINPNLAGDDGKQLQAMLDQFREGMAILKVFRSYSSSTYFENGALITHGETIIRDLPQ